MAALAPSARAPSTRIRLGCQPPRPRGPRLTPKHARGGGATSVSLFLFTQPLVRLVLREPGLVRSLRGIRSPSARPLRRRRADLGTRSARRLGGWLPPSGCGRRSRRARSRPATGPAVGLVDGVLDGPGPGRPWACRRRRRWPQLTAPPGDRPTSAGALQCRSPRPPTSSAASQRTSTSRSPFPAARFPSVAQQWPASHLSHLD